MSANPQLIGEGTPAPRQTEPAGPVTLAVPAGTAVNAVTAGTLKVTPAGDGASTMVLSGTDGATYTYTDVVGGTAPRGKVQAGTKIGVSGQSGLTFSISVPDVRGWVDADEALQAWAAGRSIDVRALPATIAPETATPPRAQVLVVSDAGAAVAAADVAKSVTGPLVKVTTETVSDTLQPGRQSPVARRLAEGGSQQLVVVVMAAGTPAQAGALAAMLPAGKDLLWVAPPGTTAKQAAAYREIIAGHPGFRVESLPTALAGVNDPSAQRQPTRRAAVEYLSAAHPAAERPAVEPLAVDSPAKTSQAAGTAAWSATGALATATLTGSYASTAYRLETVSSEASTVVSWAEEQLGKPYKWAAAGPDSFDCSGLTMAALAQAGIAVPHNADQQWLQTKAHRVAEDQLAPGDLVFFTGSDGTLTAPGHVGIYVGNDEIIDAPYTGANVRFDTLTGITGFVGATDPYVVSGALATQPIAAGGLLATPAALTQYQSFAQGLVDKTWGASQFPYLYLLWERESGWNPAAVNPTSGAFGIPQALPALKMASAGLDWASDPYTQIIWGISYIEATYGTPQVAWAHELAYSWY